MKPPLNVVYSAGYQVPGLAHFDRLALTCEIAQQRNLVRVHCPEPLALMHLHALHDASYVDAMLLEVRGKCAFAGAGRDGERGQT